MNGVHHTHDGLAPVLAGEDPVLCYEIQYILHVLHVLHGVPGASFALLDVRAQPSMSGMEDRRDNRSRLISKSRRRTAANASLGAAVAACAAMSSVLLVLVCSRMCRFNGNIPRYATRPNMRRSKTYFRWCHAFLDDTELRRAFRLTRTAFEELLRASMLHRRKKRERGDYCTVVAHGLQ